MTSWSGTWTRDAIENRAFGLLRWVVIIVLLVVTVFPFYYMAMLSFRSLDAVSQDPGGLWPSASELNLTRYASVLKSADDGGQGFLQFMRNSALVAVSAVLLTLAVALPGSYAVSRLRFFGHREFQADGGALL